MSGSVAPNLWLVASGVLVLGLAVFHSLLGELFLVRRLLRRTDLPHLFGDDSFTRLTIRYAWHLLTIVCGALTVILFVIAVRPMDATATLIARVIGGALVLGGAWGAASTRARHLSWIVLGGAGILAFVGAA